MNKTILIINAKHRLNGKVQDCDMLIEGGKIKNIASKITLQSGYEIIDFAGDYIIPGFIDIHTHGCAGTDFNSIDKNNLTNSMKYYASNGVTSLLPTIVADSKEKTLDLVSHFASFIKDSAFCQIAGLHLEGPFLSKEYNGAIPKKYLIDTDCDFLKNLQDSAQGNIKLITVSPEIKGAKELIKTAVSLDISVSIGHSGASYSQTNAAIDAGASGATHLFNAMKPLDHHEGGIVSACLENDIYCELIGDGFHINKDIFHMVYKIKDADNVIVITDSIMATGLEYGEYKLGANDVIVKDGQAKLDDNTRAGSVLSMNQAIKNIIDFLDISIFDAHKLISQNPARHVLKDNSLGRIDIDSKADILRIDKDYNVVMTFKDGRLIYSK